MALFIINSVADFITTAGSTGDIVVVNDTDRTSGNHFTWQNTGIANDGTIYQGQNGYWHMMYEGPVSVKWFGYSYGGDDTTYFQQALKYFRSLFIPAGNYKIRTLNITQTFPSVEIFGEGENSIIDILPNGEGFLSDMTTPFSGVYDDVIIRNLHFRVYSNSSAVKINRSNTQLCRLRIWDSIFYCSEKEPNNGILITGTIDGIISRNIFKTNRNYDSQFQSIKFIGKTDKDWNINNNITNNIFTNVKEGLAIIHEKEFFNLNAGYRIINNTFIGLSSYGIYAAYGDWIQIEQNMMDYIFQPLRAIHIFNLKVKHNYFSANTNNIIGQPGQVAVHVLSDVPNADYSKDNIEYTEIVGNRVFNLNQATTGTNGNDGIRVDAYGKSMNFLSISQNTIDGVTTAISINPDGNQVINSGTVESNKIRGAKNIGIYLGEQTASNIVENNVIHLELAPIQNSIVGNILGNIIKSNNFNGICTERKGTLISNGDGIKTQWIIPHGLSLTPVWGTATPCDNTIADLGLFVQYDSTNLYINFNTPPPNMGYNNVIINYYISSFF